jgi:hypothetical protein
MSWQTSKRQTVSKLGANQESYDYMIPNVVVLLPDSAGYTRLVPKRTIAPVCHRFRPTSLL